MCAAKLQEDPVDARADYATVAFTNRVHALDAVRASALLMGVFFHAAMSFLPVGQQWVIQDLQSEPVAVVYYVLHVFRMSLFFVIAGYFARLLYHRRGLRGFIRNRAVRIVAPLFVFWPLGLAAMLACFLWGARVAGVKLAALDQTAAPFTVSSFPLTHLWFLYVLTGFYIAILVLRALIVWIDPASKLRESGDTVMRLLLATPAGVLLLAAPLAVSLALSADWQGWLGIISPATGLLPNRNAVVGFGSAFVFGWLLQRQNSLLDQIKRWWPVYLTAAVVLTILCLAKDGTEPRLAATPGTGVGTTFATCYAVAVWTWTLGLIGFALQTFHIERPKVRYAADASYWIYIVHVPVVMALQIAVFPLAVPAVVKYILVVGGTFIVVFLSYEAIVRHSFLGQWLNGRKYPRRSAS
jgi:peptidoglycan/LPS O-acetylase OafA/YrhL